MGLLLPQPCPGSRSPSGSLLRYRRPCAPSGLHTVPTCLTFASLLTLCLVISSLVFRPQLQSPFLTSRGGKQILPASPAPSYSLSQLRLCLSACLSAIVQAPRRQGLPAGRAHSSVACQSVGGTCFLTNVFPLLLFSVSVSEPLLMHGLPALARRLWNVLVSWPAL